MNLLTIDFTLDQESLDIYIAGCKGPHCKNCHNELSWDFNQGIDFQNTIIKEKLDKYIKDYDIMIKKIMIFGGEPLDQNHKDLEKLLIEINKYNKEIWLFTRYNFDDIPEFIKSKCNFIKIGRYLEELKVDNYIQYGIILATSNQKIYKVK